MDVFSSATHFKLAKMERELRLLHIITQNVDNLHGKAGSKEVTELHGNGFKVICIGKGEKDNRCDYSIDRHDFQLILNQLNPRLLEKRSLFESSPESMKPDGDVEILQEDIDQFFLPECPKCGGYLKPNIVFFGDNVPRERIEKVVRLIIDSDGVLVLGSSLTVSHFLGKSFEVLRTLFSGLQRLSNRPTSKRASTSRCCC